MRIDKTLFTVFDFETTGLYPYAGDRICEVGALRASIGSGKPARFHSLVDPERPISPGAFRVNGITPEMVRGKPTIKEILPDFLDFIEGSVLVAYNAGFDMGFLDAAMPEGSPSVSGYRVIDALSLARRLFPAIGRYSLASVAGALEIDVVGEHRALADASIAWEVFKKEAELLIAGGTTEVEDIAIFQPRRKRAPETSGDARIDMVRSAIAVGKDLVIIYKSSWRGPATERVVTPKRIRSGYDRDYLVAHCHLRGQERIFRIDCITRMDMVS